MKFVWYRTCEFHFLQKSRIKQAVITVKPHLNPETALSGFGALQELEELATMDLNAPLNVQVHIQVQEPLVQHWQQLKHKIKEMCWK